MNEQEIFEYLRDNIQISVEVLEESNYGNSPGGVAVVISLRNPATGVFELVANDIS
jgi:hypothetical protein